MKNIGFGIDFGTTNSVMSAYDGRNKPTSFVDDEGLPHPSVIWFKGDREDVIVGRTAKDKIKDFSNVPGNRFVSSIKSKIHENEEIEIFGKGSVSLY